jgi:hypothetical protein
MKGSSSCSGLAFKGISFKFTATVAACTLNLDLSTSVSRKFLIDDTITAEGIETPSQVIIKEVKPLCNEEDVRT